MHLWHIEIHSLTVDQNYFRKGIADKLISYIIGDFEFIRWIPSHGIEKLAMAVEHE